MAHELIGHIALITGAGRGIGRATALRLGRAGCSLALAARTRAELEEVAAATTSMGVHAAVFPADITDDAQVASVVEQAQAALGTLSILVNNAGAAPPRTLLARALPQELDRTLATCLRAPILLSHLVLAGMLAQRRGAIINIASTAPRAARPGEAVYAAAKAGVIAFSHALFAEVREHGVKVAAICPGYVDTTFVPPNRRVDRTKFLRPDDVADAVFHVLTQPPGACVTEILVAPQFDPERA